MTLRLPRVPGRRLLLVGAVVAGLLAAALPASAAPSTKHYTATVSAASVPAGGSVTLSLVNAASSNQSFGSARVVVEGVRPAQVSVATAGWTLTPLAAGSWQLTSAGPAVAVPPGGSLPLTLVMPADGDGPSTIRTTVKQSNDFNGRNNQFTNLGADPVVQTVPPADGTYCAGSCSPTIEPSVTGTTATVTMTSAAPFRYTTGFGTGAPLSCQDVPFGPGVLADPLLVDAVGTAPIGKTITMTFPRELVNRVPDNGTPKLAICAGADAAFPGSSPRPGTVQGTYPYEGLMLDCTDPAYLAATADPAFPLHMCVASRSKKAGNETVVITIAPSLIDPRFW